MYGGCDIDEQEYITFEENQVKKIDTDAYIGPKGKVPFGPFYVKIHIEFYSLLYIIKIKGSNMKINYTMGCFHKQRVTS